MKLLLRLVVLGALVAGGAYAWRMHAGPGGVPVALATVERGQVESTVANTRAGTVMACRRSKLSPPIGGQVASMSVHEGQTVSAGQILMTLWNRDREAQVALAGSQVLAADARHREACLNAEQAAREARRLERLAEQRVVAEDQVDRAVTQARAGEAGCRAADAAREVARASVEAARAALDQTLLRAPFDGVVAEVNAEVGEFVTPSPPGIPTPPAVDLIDVGCMYVSAPIDEVDAPAVRVGMTACVSLDAFPEKRCGARVRRIAPYVLDREKQARTIEVEVELASPEERAGFLPGYTADVEIVVEKRDGVLRVPTEAVLEGHRVLVYRAGDLGLEERAFEPGLANWRHTEVRSGLTEGERVVLSVDREGVKAGARAVPESDSAGASAPAPP